MWAGALNSAVKLSFAVAARCVQGLFRGDGAGSGLFIARLLFYSCVFNGNQSTE